MLVLAYLQQWLSCADAVEDLLCYLWGVLGWPACLLDGYRSFCGLRGSYPLALVRFGLGGPFGWLGGSFWHGESLFLFGQCNWLRRLDSHQRSSGYEPDGLLLSYPAIKVVGGYTPISSRDGANLVLGTHSGVIKFTNTAGD